MEELWEQMPKVMMTLSRLFIHSGPVAQEREFTNTKSNNNGGKLLNLNQIYFFILLNIHQQFSAFA